MQLAVITHVEDRPFRSITACSRSFDHYRVPWHPFKRVRFPFASRSFCTRFMNTTPTLILNIVGLCIPLYVQYLALNQSYRRKPISCIGHPASRSRVILNAGVNAAFYNYCSTYGNDAISFQHWSMSFLFSPVSRTGLDNGGSTLLQPIQAGREWL